MAKRMTNFRSAAIATGNAIHGSVYDSVKKVADNIEGVETVAQLMDGNTVSTVNENAETALSASQNALIASWNAEAISLTANSYAAEPVGSFVKIYTSNGDGTFSYTLSSSYSAKHYFEKTDEAINGVESWTEETVLSSEGQQVITTTRFSSTATVYLNGVLLSPDNDYTVLYKDITLTLPGSAGDILTVVGVSATVQQYKWTDTHIVVEGESFFVFSYNKSLLDASIYVNGVLLSIDIDYTVEDTTITFVHALELDDVLTVIGNDNASTSLDYLTLSSPNGTNYKVAVDDAGSLTVLEI